METTIVRYEPEDGKSDAKARRLEVTTGARTVPDAEMHSGCDRRYTARIRGGTWPVLDSIAYILSSEKIARAHLHELWLRELPSAARGRGTPSAARRRFDGRKYR